LGASRKPQRRDVEGVKLSTGALQGSEERQNQEIQQLKGEVKRLEALIAEQQKHEQEMWAIADI
jgi:hypothetical protein